jgi:hypothetical protein
VIPTKERRAARRRAELARRRAGHQRRDAGYIIWMIALTMIVLWTACAFAIDLGSWYARASRIQRVADSAALAGVVWMPGDYAQAQTDALAVASKNGFNSGVTVSPVSGNPYQLKVSINDPNVPRFFSSILSKSSVSITRSAIAEFAPLVPLGSPDNRLGNDPLASPPYDAYLWASISAPYTDKNNGDPFSTKCGNGSAGTSCSQTNVQYRTSGYKYAIDVPASAVGRTLTLSIYDAGNYARPNYADVETADNGTVNTSFELFDVNPAPLDIGQDFSSALSLNGKCESSTPGKFVILNGQSSSTYKNEWADLCTITVTKAGTYHLQVKSSALTTTSGTAIADSGNGWNQFSLKASVSGTGVSPSLYGVGDLSLFNNLPGLSGNITATFFFAEIEQVYAGKTLSVLLFDPGDGASGNYFVNVFMPGSATTSCKYGVQGSTLTNANPCRFQTRNSSGNTYNGKWVEIAVNIPLTYTCSADCWWKISYEFNNVTSGNSPNDRTVWSATLSGNPIHLVQ